MLCAGGCGHDIGKGRAIYCSGACSSRAYRARHPDRYAARKAAQNVKRQGKARRKPACNGAPRCGCDACSARRYRARHPDRHLDRVAKQIDTKAAVRVAYRDLTGRRAGAGIDAVVSAFRHMGLLQQEGSPNEHD